MLTLEEEAQLMITVCSENHSLLFCVRVCFYSCFKVEIEKVITCLSFPKYHVEKGV